jgi:protein TonB
MLPRQKNPKLDIKLKYRRNFELGMVVALFIFAFTFTIFKKFHDANGKEFRSPEPPIIKAEDIPKTLYPKRPPEPKKPEIPISSENENIPEDVTIENTDIDFNDVPILSPPPILEEDVPDFVPVPEEYPEPIGGHGVIKKFLEYPEIARKAGQEGKVFLEIIVDEKGNVISARMLKGPAIFEESAIKAIYKVKFKPAKQRDKPVKVKVTYTIDFKLK